MRRRTRAAAAAVTDPVEWARVQVADAAVALAAQGLNVGTAGNVSVRVGEKLVAITPSGVAAAELAVAPELVAVHALDGSVVDDPLPASSELPLHLAVYAATDVAAVVHTHSPAATALSLLVTEVPPVHYYAADLGNPIRVVPYAPFGSDELADSVAAALGGASAALLAHHGAVTTGPYLTTALDRAATLEWLCEVYLRAAAAGRPAVLGEDAVTAAAEALAAYRTSRPDPPKSPG